MLVQRGRTCSLSHVVETYLDARRFVIDMGFESELRWQEDVTLEGTREEDFLRESGWVIMSSGMREAVVRRRFPAVSDAFCGWESAESIVAQREWCRTRALSAFAHTGKIDAILTIVHYVAEHGIDYIKRELASEGASYLQRFPYLGPATSLHLAKNLGMSVAKPDRHLERIASLLGYDRTADLCAEISRFTADPVPVVDIVLWRFATLDSDYLRTLRPAE